MIKKENIKSEFEREVKVPKRVTPFGRSVRVVYEIRIGDALRNTTISLFAKELGTRNKWVVARSYSMSYKSAHRLVCSL